MYKITVILAIFLQASIVFGKNASYLKVGFRQCIFYGEWNESKCLYDEIKSQISYNLFTNKGEYHTLNTNNSSHCPNRNKPVKIIVHGWRSSAKNDWVLKMAAAYSQKGSYNVIAVDWSEPAHKLNYFESAFKTVCIGNMIGKFIVDYLQDTCDIPTDQVHLIGHSLGAHVSGFAGKYVSGQSTQVNRISGLDPAGLCFSNTSPANRLYRGDGHHVDIYHTDTVIGSTEAVGDYDFYPNEGTNPQPGCDDDKPSFFDMFKDIVKCSHSRAYELYTESINSNDFIAQKCERKSLKDHFEIISPDTEIMGEGLTTQSPPGLYCLETNDKPPYAKKIKLNIFN